MLLCLALIASACSSDDDDDGAPSSAVLGVEQYPECLNPITDCGDLSWMHWAFTGQVLPRLMEFDASNEFVPSPVLAGEPVLSGEGTGNGSGPFSVTYEIDDDAEWNDGTSLTSADIEFTWRAHLDTTGSTSASTYDLIASIDADDDRTAIVTFKQPYAAWADLFGGSTGYVLKKDAFDDTDLEGELATEIPFSAGPFVLTSFSPTEAVLEANEKYWDETRRPELDRVTLVPQSPENGVTALIAEEIDAIYPAPAPGLPDQLDVDGIDAAYGTSTRYEGLFFALMSQKNPASPLSELAVREALLHAVDREAILEEVIRPDFPDAEQLDCALWAPSIGPWCDEDDYADVEYDPDKVTSVLEQAGWRKGSDGIYAKEGRRLSLTWQTDIDSKRRLDVQALTIEKAEAAGIELVPDNATVPTLVPRLGRADFEVLMLGQTTSIDPSVTTNFSCDELATPANDFAGGNVFGYCNPDATQAMVASDTTTDVDDRVALIHRVGDFLRRDAVMLPLYQLPLITAWNSTRLRGPIGAYTSSPNGGFANLYDWSVKR